MFGPPPTPSISTIFSSNTAAAITGKAQLGDLLGISLAHTPWWTVSATGPVSGTSRLRSTPRWRATRQVYRRGSYLTKTKVDKISGDFPRFCQLYFSSFRSFRTNMILLSAWCCLLLIVRLFSCCFIEIPASMRIRQVIRHLSCLHWCWSERTRLSNGFQRCHWRNQDFPQEVTCFFVAKYETSAASLFPIKNVGQTHISCLCITVHPHSSWLVSWPRNCC